MRKAQFTRLITVTVSNDMYTKVKQITDQKNISISEWFRKAAEKLMSEEEDQKSNEGGN